MDAGESARRVFLFRNAVADVRRWLEMPQVRLAAGEGGDVWRRLVTSEARLQAVAAILDACVPAEGMAEGMTGIFEHPGAAFHARYPVPDEPRRSLSQRAGRLHRTLRDQYRRLPLRP